MHCGSAWTNVSDSLTLLQGSIVPSALKDLRLASPSPAYRTFFKDVKYAPFVQSILRDIIIGPRPSPGGNMQVTGLLIVCVPRPGLLTYNLDGVKRDQYNECARNPQIAAVGLVGAEIIALCPHFWTLAQVPTKPNCLYVNSRKNEFSRSLSGARAERAFLDYQVYALMSEITFLNLYAVSQSLLDIQGVNECVALSARESSENARNYDYYVASESPFCSRQQKEPTQPSH